MVISSIRKWHGDDERETMPVMETLRGGEKFQ